MHRPLVLIVATAIFLCAGHQATANDYGFATNLVTRHRGRYIPWRITIYLIDHFIEGTGERVYAIESLIRYPETPGLVPHLKRYSEDSDHSVRIATFWPLYKNGQKDFALALVRHELQENQRATWNVFYMPNWVGTEYKIELSRNDHEFETFVEQTALNMAIDPWIRIGAAIHLTSIGKKDLAVQVASEILSNIPPDDNTMEYSKWPRSSQDRWHLRRNTEGCLKLAGKPLTTKRAPNIGFSRKRRIKERL